jgi:hydantoinase/carbamoylase family amidase
MTLPVDPKRVVADLKELRARTATELGSQRLAWTQPWREARNWLREALAGVPVEEHVDEAGNLWLTLRGASDDLVVVGSHLDSVPGGGWLDGALGVMTGAEVVRAAAAGSTVLPFSLAVVDWADEEGARFGRSLFGSGAVSGSLELDTVAKLKDRDGTRLPDAIGVDGVRLDNILDAGAIAPRIRAYAELHIEQGPVLEAEGLHLGAVTGTMGVERHRIILLGQNAHAGATPIHLRRDTTLAAARMGLRFREIALGKGSLCTVGGFTVSPGVPTVVNGRTEFTIDVRSVDPDVLQATLADIRTAIAEIAADENVDATVEVIWQIQPLPFHPDLVDAAERFVAEETGVAKRLPSGPLHDAAEMCRMGVPTVMVFTPSINGLSHTHIEDTDEVDLEAGVRVFGKLVDHIIDWVAHQPPSTAGAR